MNTLRIDFDEVNRAALPKLEGLLRSRLPDGVIKGQELIARNPTRADAKAGSFSINLRTGVWADFATDAKGGGAISLVAYLDGSSPVAAAKELAQTLGLDGGPGDSLPKSRSTARKKALRTRKTRPTGEVYSYRDRTGKEYAVTVRTAQFKALPWTLETDGTWTCRAPAKRYPYACDRIADNPDAIIIWVEGERCAAALQEAVGDAYIVTTALGGSKAVHKTEWIVLKGRSVILWPDNDEPGLHAARNLISRGIGTRLVEWGDKPGDDAHDAIQRGLMPLALIDGATAIKPPEAPHPDADAPDFDEDGESLVLDAAAKLEAWYRAIPQRVNAQGKIILPRSSRGLEHALRMLRLDARYNTRLQMVQYLGSALDAIPAVAPGEWATAEGNVPAFIRELIAGKFRTTTDKPQEVDFRLRKDIFNEFMAAIVATKEVDPAVLMLEALDAWDGVDRLNTMFETLFHIAPGQNQELLRYASRSTILTAVARAYKPGLKVDEVVVLSGPQGCGKSTFAKYINPPETRDEWFSDSVRFDADPKSQVEGIKGRWIVEFSEAVGLTRAGIGQLKMFITRTDDGSIRLAYRPDPVRMLRRCAFIITTNEERPLPNDPTGNRRFVVVRLDPDNPSARHKVENWMDENREQLLAQAVHLVKSGEHPGLPRDLRVFQDSANEEYRDEDTPREEAILQAFPDGCGDPGLTLEQVALLAGALDERDGSHTTWARYARAEMVPFRKALLNAGWRQTATKRRYKTKISMYRWYTTNPDAPSPDAFIDAAERKKADAADKGDKLQTDEEWAASAADRMAAAGRL